MLAHNRLLGFEALLNALWQARSTSVFSAQLNNVKVCKNF
jgi:hypothetical protein